MSSQLVTIQVHNIHSIHDEETIMISEALTRKCKIPLHRPVQLRFGSFRQTIHIAPQSRTNMLSMNERLAAKLMLKKGQKIRIKYNTSTNTLQIGPLLGVLISRVYSNNPSERFGAITTFCKELTEACQTYGATVFFFTPEEIGVNPNGVLGWNDFSTSTKLLFPFPDVVHNRLTSRKLENKPSVQQFMKEVKSKYNASVFNEKYLNKNEVFNALQNEPTISLYLPESHMLNNFQTLRMMCNKYRHVFIKPVTGSLGKGIIRISRDGASYICSYSSMNGVRKQSFSRLAEVYSFLSGKAKLTRDQIQQGLPLIEVSGRPVDFRALVQKNLVGEWELTSIVARIAGNHFVSNLAKGGSLTSVTHALARSNLAELQRKSSFARLRHASIKIAKALERQIPSHFGELGIDLAMDAKGRVWLLEVNSKPSKNDNSPLSDRKIRPSVKKIVHYTRYLSGI